MTKMSIESASKMWYICKIEIIQWEEGMKYNMAYVWALKMSQEARHKRHML